MSTPKYEQLKQGMRDNIREGLWKRGERIPLEKTLCDVFDVSLITVKKAKRDLINEGVLTQLPGRRGTFVSHAPRISSGGFIGVAIDNVKNPFIAEMLHGMEDKLWEHSLHTILCNAYYDFEKVEAFFQSLLQRDVAGVILTPVKGPGYSENNAKLITMLADKHIPYVLLDRYIPDMLLNSVVSDNHQASKAVTRQLVQKGHTRILVLAGVECSSIQDRLHGHLEALQEAGLSHDPRLIVRVDDLRFLDHRSPDELLRMQTLIEHAGHFTACYSMSNRILQIAIQALVAGDRLSCKDVEIVTYDDITIDLVGIAPCVTIVKQPGYTMGSEAARLLIDTITTPERPAVQMTLKAEIVEQAIT